MITMITGRGNGKSLMIEVANGNPGCLQFLMELCNLPNGIETILMLKKYGLVGSRAYQLWNDCCDRNAELAAEILEATEMGKLTKEELFHNIDQPYGLKFDIEEIRQREPIRKEGYLMKKHGMMIMGKVPEGACPECAMVHDPAMPHNQQSLAYQYHFYDQNGRWPTWADAMAHCTEDVKEQWIAALKERGIEVE